MAEQDRTAELAHVVAAAVVRDVDDRPAMLQAAAMIASGDPRVASRFGYAIATALADELRHGQSTTRTAAEAIFQSPRASTNAEKGPR